MCVMSNRKRKKNRFSRRHKKGNFKNQTHKRNTFSEEKDFQGVVSVIRSGDAFVRNMQGEEVFVPKFCVNSAMHGDEVEAQILQSAIQKGKSPEACITRIIKRNSKNFTGNIEQDINGFYIKPDNPKLPSRFELMDEGVQIVKNKDKVFVEFISWNNPKNNPLAKVKEILGKAGEHEAETKAILLNHSFSQSFAPNVEEYAQKIKKEVAQETGDIKYREDFRSKITFTIDPDDAKDFDDALSVLEKESGYEVGVHIADVTHFVMYGDPIDKEAQKRGTSVYLVDRTIPMLPEVLSNDLCSLNPGEDKRAFSVIFDFDKEFNLLKYRFAKTLINSNKRFTYKEAQNVLDTKSGTFLKELQVLQSIAKKERARREKAGAMDFDSVEIKFELDKDGKPIKVMPKERLETMKIIEDLMLLANKSVAEFMQNHIKQNKKQTFIFRVHDEPDTEKIEELSVFLEALGYELKHEKGSVDLLSLSEMLKSVKNSILSHTIEQATLRAMAKAVYSHKNIGHFSLAFEDYTHFTSPIRRYPDVMVHRILWSVLQNESLPKEELDHYKLLAVESSKKEIEATKAERDSVKYKQVEFMASMIGKEFRCVVTGISKNGAFLADKETFAEGFAPLSNIPGYFTYDEKQHALKSENRIIRIGQEVRARLKKADLDSKTIDWEILG